MYDNRYVDGLRPTTDNGQRNDETHDGRRRTTTMDAQRSKRRTDDKRRTTDGGRRTTEGGRGARDDDDDDGDGDGDGGGGDANRPPSSLLPRKEKERRGAATTAGSWAPGAGRAVGRRRRRKGDGDDGCVEGHGESDGRVAAVGDAHVREADLFEELELERLVMMWHIRTWSLNHSQ